jgi:hypothetical protein
MSALISTRVSILILALGALMIPGTDLGTNLGTDLGIDIISPKVPLLHEKGFILTRRTIRWEAHCVCFM